MVALLVVIIMIELLQLLLQVLAFAPKLKSEQITPMTEEEKKDFAKQDAENVQDYMGIVKAFDAFMTGEDEVANVEQQDI